VDQRLSLVTLGVADLERARRFYEDGLGWRHAGNAKDVYFFQSPGMVVALWRRADLASDAGVPDDGRGFPGVALAHNVRQRPDVDAVIAEVRAAGGEVLKPPQDTFWGGYSAYFADPDGHIWEVAWNPEWELAEDGAVRLPY
jgi:catechol 2,3-dioxygenase-like lactoylglutathione lyase family enzyme